jgi:phenylphosphate carboxylase alpha subunit
VSRGAQGIWSRIALALELNPEAPYREILDEFVGRLEAPIKPLQVNGGPCKEIVTKGDDIDLAAFPAPLLHEGDGGPCLASWSVAIGREPGSGFVAWDVAPQMVVGRNRLASALAPSSDLGTLFFEEYEPRGEEMPLAVAIGSIPATCIAAALTIDRRSGDTAAEVAGGLQREPIHMVSAEDSELLVPASSELVLEGALLPGARAPFGPFATSYGYRRASEEAPVFEVRTVTHRPSPILPMSTWGIPMSEIHLVRGLDYDSCLKRAFGARGWPVTDVFTPPWLAGNLVAVSSKIPFSAFSQSIAGVVRTSGATRCVPYVAVFDDDIDITNPVSLFHALVTKCHPDRDTWFVQDTAAAPDAPHLSPAEVAAGKGPSVIFDATWPRDWDPSIAVPPRVSFDQCYPEEIQEKVLAAWSTDYGFPPERDRPAA